jgi:hypothetical protein
MYLLMCVRIVRLPRPGRCRQNAQWIWSSPLTGEDCEVWVGYSAPPPSHPQHTHRQEYRYRCCSMLCYFNVNFSWIAFAYFVKRGRPSVYAEQGRQRAEKNLSDVTVVRTVKSKNVQLLTSEFQRHRIQYTSYLCEAIDLGGAALHSCVCDRACYHMGILPDVI